METIAGDRSVCPGDRPRCPGGTDERVPCGQCRAVKESRGPACADGTLSKITPPPRARARAARKSSVWRSGARRCSSRQRRGQRRRKRDRRRRDGIFLPGVECDVQPVASRTRGQHPDRRGGTTHHPQAVSRGVGPRYRRSGRGFAGRRSSHADPGAESLPSPVESITSAFERRQLPPADLLDTLPEARERIFTRRYPEPAGPPRHRMRRPSKEIDALRTRARFFIASQLEQQTLGAAGEQPTHSLRGRVS